MAKKTKSNSKGSGRNPMFKIKFGKSKRISITIPELKETEVRKLINNILEPYKY